MPPRRADKVVYIPHLNPHREVKPDVPRTGTPQNPKPPAKEK